MATRQQRKIGAASLVLLGLVFVAAVTANNTLLSGLRFDLTENDLYTVSPGTRTLLASIQEPINLYFFFSDSETADIVPLRTFAARVRELLEEKDEGLTAFKEMEAAALRLQEDIIKRCAERDNLLERMSELEVCTAAPVLPHYLQKKSPHIEYPMQPQRPLEHSLHTPCLS